MHRLAHSRTLLWSLLAFAPVIALGGWAVEAASGGGGTICFGKEATLAYPDTQFVDGTPGADVIVTGAQVQLIDAKGGDDRVCAGGKDDVIKSGPGNDKVDGENGDDNMRGGPGNDRLKGGDGGDLLDGRGGDDRCIGGSGFDLASPTRCERIRGAATRA